MEMSNDISWDIIGDATTNTGMGVPQELPKNRDLINHNGYIWGIINMTPIWVCLTVGLEGTVAKRPIPKFSGPGNINQSADLRLHWEVLGFEVFGSPQIFQEWQEVLSLSWYTYIYIYHNANVHTVGYIYIYTYMFVYVLYIPNTRYIMSTLRRFYVFHFLRLDLLASSAKKRWKNATHSLGPRDGDTLWSSSIWVF